MSEISTNGFWKEPANGATDSNQTNGFSMEGLLQKAERAARPTPFPKPPSISIDEWTEARLGPRPVVENFLYEDVGVLVAPGGTGKTSLVLFEAIHVVLGWPLFGAEVVNPGPVIVLTAEDDRESLIGRLRTTALQMGLSNAEIDRIRGDIRISDVSGQSFRLSRVTGDMVKPSRDTERLIRSIEDIQPAVLFIDPAVSFGVGENRVNDAEQGLIESARMIRNEVSCAVMFVHHTGKSNARNQAIDQYAGRGGSAFADGSRMVHVLQAVGPSDWLKTTGAPLCDGEVGLILARPKISHAPPQPPIYLKRSGHIFSQHGASASGNSVLISNADKTIELIRSEIAGGRMPTGRSLEAIDSGLRQKELRDAIAWLRSSGRIVDMPTKSIGRGGARFYLKPADAPTDDDA